jgi:hypothetical protein
MTQIDRVHVALGARAYDVVIGRACWHRPAR